MGQGKPIILTDSSYSAEKENQAHKKDHISDQGAEDALPENGFRAKANAVDHTGAYRPHDEKTVPDFKLAGLRREARRVPENAARQQ